MCSRAALAIYAAIREGVIKSNAQFWREYNSLEKLYGLDLRLGQYEEEITRSAISLTCIFDNNFPFVDNLKPSERPCFFAYRGDISLLNNVQRNAAVIGTLEADKDIFLRENKIIDALVLRGVNIVSGLAEGCDATAHLRCLEKGGKTIAFLPSTLEKIYPRKNAGIASRIVDGGGLLITEYITETKDRYEMIRRFIDRDRLQAMYVGAVILVSSCLPGQGDSGSRHAMAKASEYGVKRYVMYNEFTDKDNMLFGLNRRLKEQGAAVLTVKELDKLF